MNKKTTLKYVGMMIIGGIFGALLSLGLINGKEKLTDEIFPLISTALMDNSFYIMLFVTLTLLIPTIFHFVKGKSLMKVTIDLDDDALDIVEKKAQKHSNKAMAFNSILLVLNFMMYGMSFDSEGLPFIAKTILFLIVLISCSILELKTIKLIQKYDSRLKGDPGSLKFQKDLLESCDEAEKLKIYETGFKAYQFTKDGALIMVVVTIILKVTGISGSFPVFISSTLFLMIVASFNYYAIKAEQ